MHESDLQVFIDGTTHYFQQTSHQAAAVGTPYLLDTSTSICYDFTGIIGIAGRRKGCVYFTAPTTMLTHLLTSLGETEITTEYHCDLVGEVANTISGNARKAFGQDFMISVPVVVAGEPDQIKLPKAIRSFVIPITWCQHQAALVISLE
jgi:chemotaxis protein CheX